MRTLHKSRAKQSGQSKRDRQTGPDDRGDCVERMVREQYEQNNRHWNDREHCHRSAPLRNLDKPPE